MTTLFLFSDANVGIIFAFSPPKAGRIISIRSVCETTRVGVIGRQKMENSVTAIIEMDKKARAVSEEAERKAAAIIAEARAKKDSLAKESAEKLAAEADRRFAEIKTASDKEIAAAEKKADEKCSVLDEKMSAGKDKWKKEITERILAI